MQKYEALKQYLAGHTHTWLITGVAGFIGSHLLENLLKLQQRVIGVDNFLSGHVQNLEHVQARVKEQEWKNFRFVQGDISDLASCHQLMRGVNYVLHHAALGSVSRSLEDPLLSNRLNIDAFLHILLAAKDARVKRVIFATSSAVYGDSKDEIAIEDRLGNPLSPYAVGKRSNELYAQVFASQYSLESIGLRYFNVYGPRQDPNGSYAAVIPKWTAAMLKGEEVYIFGDGENTRDFCYVEDVVQANLLAATCTEKKALSQVYNIASGTSSTLKTLYRLLQEELVSHCPSIRGREPIYQPPRQGDVRYSKASIEKAKSQLFFAPYYGLVQGVRELLPWYLEKAS